MVDSFLEAPGPILVIPAHFSRSSQSTRDILMTMDLKSSVTGVLKLFFPGDWTPCTTGHVISVTLKSSNNEDKERAGFTMPKTFPRHPSSRKMEILLLLCDQNSWLCLWYRHWFRLLCKFLTWWLISLVCISHTWNIFLDDYATRNNNTLEMFEC